MTAPDETTAYCSASECGRYPTSDSRLCGGCRNRLAALIGAVPSLIDFARANRMPGAAVYSDRITGSKEAPTPVNLTALVNADDLYAITASWAKAVADEHGLPMRELTGWRIHGVIVGLTSGQDTSDPTWCAKFLLRHLDWIVTTDLAGDIHDEVNEVVGPVRARWQMEERPRWVPCPTCDQLTLARYAPTFAGGPVTYSCTSPECGSISVEENDFLGRAHQRIKRHQREKETA